MSQRSNDSQSSFNAFFNRFQFLMFDSLVNVQLQWLLFPLTWSWRLYYCKLWFGEDNSHRTSFTEIQLCRCCSANVMQCDEKMYDLLKVFLFQYIPIDPLTTLYSFAGSPFGYKDWSTFTSTPKSTLTTLQQSEPGMTEPKESSSLSTPAHWVSCCAPPAKNWTFTWNQVNKHGLSRNLGYIFSIHIRHFFWLFSIIISICIFISF